MILQPFVYRWAPMQSGLVIGADVTAEVRSWIEAKKWGLPDNLPRWLTEATDKIPFEISGFANLINKYIQENCSIHVRLQMFDDPDPFVSLPRFVLCLSKLSRTVDCAEYFDLQENEVIKREFKDTLELFRSGSAKFSIVSGMVDTSSELTQIN